MTDLRTFVTRLRRAGIEPDDPEDLRIKKTILIFATGLMTAAPMVWLALYWGVGRQLSATLPLAYQLVSVGTLVVYAFTGNFNFLRYAQLCLFLFFPFVGQLLIGDYVSASGLVLWGVLAPVCAVLVLSGRDSIPWFVAHVSLLAFCGYIDFELAAPLKSVPPAALRTSALFFALNFMAITSIIYFLLRYAAQEKERYQQATLQAHGMLQAEKQRADHLLLNILPVAVAERLKREESTIADGFADVTVMFADIVNFTTIAEGLSPGQTFTMLNRVFSRFDELTEKYGLEKIKTIGDAYMVAGGLPGGRPDEYTDAMADIALEMREVAAGERVRGQMLELRLGISTGPVLAGVVGTKKFIYDLWGDTVNLASRLTSEATPGMIQADATTWRRLRHRYDFHPPQTIHLKGKGETTVYRLIGKKAAAVAA